MANEEDLNKYLDKSGEGTDGGMGLEGLKGLTAGQIAKLSEQGDKSVVSPGGVIHFSLDPDEAGSLKEKIRKCEELRKKERLTNDEIEFLVRNASIYQNELELNIKELTEEQARELSKVNRLTLDGLTSLDVSVAEELSKLEHLSLNGLTDLDVLVAETLLKGNITHLFLNGLTSLDVSVARELSKVRHLILNGLTNLDVLVAKELASGNVEVLILNGLTSLELPVAEALASGKIEYICLENLPKEKIADDVKNALGSINLVYR